MANPFSDQALHRLSAQPESGKLRPERRGVSGTWKRSVPHRALCAETDAEDGNLVNRAQAGSGGAL
jgi:hypothetical protein